MPTRSKSQEERLRTLFKYFVDVVRINLFITTSTGKSVITPEFNPYGWTLLADTTNIQDKFQQMGNLLEYVDDYYLHHFAFPIRSGYVILGPLIINKKLDRNRYVELAIKSNADPDYILDAVEEIRVVSQNQLKSILDLIAEAKDFFIHDEDETSGGVYSTRFIEQQLNATLTTLLDRALRMARASSGSIMMYDPVKGLTMRVSRGIDPQFQRKLYKLGEGISGLALQDMKTFILNDTTVDNRIAHLLSRKEIKQSIVMPFENATGGVRGVLNLNLEQVNPKIREADGVLQNLEKLTHAAFQACS